jgi:hypothetical protein
MKDFETPLGTVKTDKRIVEELMDSSRDCVLADDLPHRHEHSIEFQVLFLRHVLANPDLSIVPILCGSLRGSLDSYGRPSEIPCVGGFLAALRGAMEREERRCLIVAGVDFSHIGIKFGEAMTAVEAKMRGTLADIESKRVSLRQPDELKPAFAAAYVRTVTAPAEAFLATVPPVTNAVRLSLRLADYLDTHRASVRVSGAMIQTSDTKAQAEINQMLDALKAQNQRLNDARRRLQAVISGK